MSEPSDPRVRLLEIDHENAVRIVDAAAKSLGIVRGWAVTVWLGLVAAALEIHNSLIAFLALVPLIAFGLHDGYLSWAYRVALAHARRVERVWQAVYDAASRGTSDETVRVEADAKIQAHRLGAIFEFRRFSRAEFRKAVPASKFWVVYAFLALCAIAIGSTLALTSDSGAKRHKPSDTQKLTAAASARVHVHPWRQQRFVRPSR